MLEDVRAASDLLAGVFDESGGLDGFVSLEVSPHLVHDTQATVEEAERLWAALNRRNVMIKVPGTAAGLTALARLTARGINVNITLLFSLERYREVIDAYLSGLEQAAEAGVRLDGIASVASFFLSRIDSMVDPRIERIVARGDPEAAVAQPLRGEVAVACARRAYAIFTEVFHSERYEILARQGARKQRLLWASTGTKNPRYSDLKYVEPLIGPDTISTMPLETLKAYDDHGQPASRLDGSEAAAARVLTALQEAGVELREVAEQLLVEGIDKFVEPFDASQRLIEGKRLSINARSRLTAG